MPLHSHPSHSYPDAVDRQGSDPFMAWVTPVAQYGFDYTVATAESAVSEDYFQVCLAIGALPFTLSHAPYVCSCAFVR